MIKNGKFFLPPPREGGDFKALFKRIAAAGAGRPVGKDGFPAGPWTPDLLADAISQINANRAGIDLRTVQLWFQDNDRGISPTNIRWLARVLGCDDPVATSEWQIELSAAQARLTAKRQRRNRAGSNNSPDSVVELSDVNDLDETEKANTSLKTPRSFNLAVSSEAFISRQSPLDLPATVFAGAVALGFLSYIFNIHNIVYEPEPGAAKQVGFLWAPNWTILFLVTLPLYLMFAGELLTFWKDEGRNKLISIIYRSTSASEHEKSERSDDWTSTVKDFTHSYWASFIICLPVAALFQWLSECLLPLITGNPRNFGVDWGRIAIFHPELISAVEAAIFTGLAYLYMGICFYLFFAGLILLFTMAHDLSKLGGKPELWHRSGCYPEACGIGLRLMRGVFRCSVLGIAIATCMKIQQVYMISPGENIINWLLGDILSVIYGHERITDGFTYSRPTLYSSLLVVLSSCAVFLHGLIRIHDAFGRYSSFDSSDSQNLEKNHKHAGEQSYIPYGRMTGVIVLLLANYFLVGVANGSSFLLIIGACAAIYSLFDPGIGGNRAS